MKIDTFSVIYCETMPDTFEQGILYISKKYGCAIHLCACGCGEKTNTAFKPEWSNGWDLTDTGGLITLRPSIGNFNGENSYHAHYYITNNKVEWL